MPILITLTVNGTEYKQFVNLDNIITIQDGELGGSTVQFVDGSFANYEEDMDDIDDILSSPHSGLIGALDFLRGDSTNKGLDKCSN